jgi:hypothetical protein
VRIFVDGKYVGSTRGNHYSITTAPGHSPIIEVLDDPLAVPTIARSAHVTLTWTPAADAQRYRIERYTGSGWEIVDDVQAKGLSQCRYRTRGLPWQVSPHSFRVFAIGENENPAGHVTVFVNMKTRHPDPPAVTTTYDEGTNKVTIAAA